MKKKLFRILFCAIMIFSSLDLALAASYNISVGSRNVTKGSTTKLTIKGSEVTGRFNISSSNPSVVSVSEDRAWIENDSYSITLSGLSVGTATITVTPSGVSDSSGNTISLGAKTITVTVALPREKSADNNLGSLSVEGYEISPEFNKDVLDYKVSVPEGTAKVNIKAAANDKYATVSGTGEVEVTNGINTFNIVVRSETGVEKTYNLVVDVIDQNPVEINMNGNSYTVVKLRDNFTCSSEYEESETTVKEFTVPTCQNKKTGITLVGLKDADGNIISAIYEEGTFKEYNEFIGKETKIIILKYDGILNGLKKYKETINDNEYEVFKYSESSRYYVIYGMDVSTGEKNLYIYDSKSETISTYDTEYIESLEKTNTIYLYIIIGFSIMLLLSIICMIKMNSKKKRKKDNKKEIFEEIEDNNIIYEKEDKK